MKSLQSIKFGEMLVDGLLLGKFSDIHDQIINLIFTLVQTSSLNVIQAI